MGTPDASNLIWIDLEMTGLDPASDVIIEVATIVTDAQLNSLAEGPVLAVHQSDAVLDGMDEWNRTHHGQSGLVDRVRRSALDVATAEQQTLAFLRQWVPPGASPMCGNSICQRGRKPGQRGGFKQGLHGRIRASNAFEADASRSHRFSLV
ncbi:MAG: oligoribonuclease, partial [Pseudomonadota bacterium]